MTVYSWANQSRRYDSRYPGQVYRGGPNKGVLHTTETTTLPGYQNGAQAPHLTIVPDLKAQKLVPYQHYDSARPSRALVDQAGGVQTNNDGAFQIELVGSCSKSYVAKYGGIFWPDPPQWAKDQLLEILAKVNSDRGIPMRGPARGWLPYPASYGSTRARMSPTEWDNFAGWCGHQHVPENDHGDPGDLSWVFANQEDNMTPAQEAKLDYVSKQVKAVAELVIKLSEREAARDAAYQTAMAEAVKNGGKIDPAAVTAAVEQAMAGLRLTVEPQAGV